MNIILEGPDNAGKSTLAAAISAATGWPIKDKEGRPPTQLLLFEKFRKYEALDGMIIDRHPIVSQSIYGLMRKDKEVPEEFLENFFDRGDLIIYCRCVQIGLHGHTASDTDTTEHLEMIEADQQRILGTYDNWAAMCADIVYKTWVDLPMVVAMVKAVLDERG
jgi:hypothetical protein